MTSTVDRRAIPDAPAAPAQLSDRAALALVAGAWAGARWAGPVPLAVGMALLAAALAWRRPVLLVAAVAALAAALGARSLAGLMPPAPGPVDGIGVLVADPQVGDFDTRAELRLDGRRVLVRADDGGAGSLAAARMGERVRVVGRLRAPPPGSGWMVPRHLVAVVEASAVERVDAGGAPARAANRLRALIDRSTTQMAHDDRALYLGFVLGDDRDQPPTVTDDFRGTGLSHLMVVSGQNLAFVLVLVGPLVRRVRWGGRWAITVAVVGAFVMVTRFEPSVLRAGAMAVVAVSGQALGRPSPPWRNLALAVTAMVLIDPLLVRSVGFQLSVAATGAIAVLSAPIAHAIPGPRALAAAVATSAAAQVGVTPILLSFAGGAPVTSVPANVLAGPAAAVVTTVGLPAGVVGGVLGGSWATVLHVPTVVSVRWVAAVARVGASLPLGELGLTHLAGLGIAVALAAAPARAWSTTWARPAAAVLAIAVLASPGLALRSPPALVRTPEGLEVWRAEGATVVAVEARTRAERLLRDLRRAGVRRIDVLVVRGSGVEGAALLRHRWTVVRVVDRTTEATTIRAGPIEVVARPPGPPTVALVP